MRPVKRPFPTMEATKGINAPRTDTCRESSSVRYHGGDIAPIRYVSLACDLVTGLSSLCFSLLGISVIEGAGVFYQTFYRHWSSIALELFSATFF